MVKIRRFPSGTFLHVFNRSIANFRIFKYSINCERFINICDYYNNSDDKQSFSTYLKLEKKPKFNNLLFLQKKNILKFIAYCIMPDHYHLLIKILCENLDLSKYINDVENSFTRYFNIKFKRKGPLWESGFKRVKIKTNEQLLHVSRYIHLNPTTSNLVSKPEDWRFSSYHDYINNRTFLNKIIKEISISNPKTYKKFVEDQKEYQKKLKMIKKLIFD